MSRLMQLEDRYRSLLRFCYYAILMLGAAMRIHQYLMGRSLWEDEAHLALSFLSRGYPELLQPLDYIQAAPPLFLWSVEAFTRLLGEGPIGFRALPFVSSLLTLPLFYQILREVCRSRIVALTGFFAFSVNAAVIYFSSELKTYGLDVAVYLLMIWLAVSLHPVVAARRNIPLLAGGILSMLYSNVAFVMLFCIACRMFLQWRRRHIIDRAQIGVLAGWAAVFAAYYVIFVHDHPYARIQRGNYYFGFPPLPLFSPEFNSFMIRSVQEICFDLLLYVSRDFGFAYIFATLVLTGLIHAVYRRRYEVLLFSCLPVLIHFSLSLFRIYPFWYRLILYLVPAILLLTSYGLWVIVSWISERQKPVWGMLAAAICALFLTKESFAAYPIWFREVGPALARINREHRGKLLYITTPYTLYKYHFLRGIAKNERYEGLPWHIGPEQYYSLVAGAGSNYVLLHAADTSVDGYGSVLADLRRRGLIVRSFSYKTYVVSEVKPLQADTGALLIHYRHFPEAHAFDLNGQRMVAVWNGSVSSNPVTLRKGKYQMTVHAMGTPAAGVYPRLRMYLGDEPVLDLSAGAALAPHDSKLFELKEDKPVAIKATLENDANDTLKGEDRNAFIHLIRIRSMK